MVYAAALIRKTKTQKGIPSSVMMFSLVLFCDFISVSTVLHVLISSCWELWTMICAVSVFVLVDLNNLGTTLNCNLCSLTLQVATLFSGWSSGKVFGGLSISFPVPVCDRGWVFFVFVLPLWTTLLQQSAFVFCTTHWDPFWMFVNQPMCIMMIQNLPN